MAGCLKIVSLVLAMAPVAFGIWSTDGTLGFFGAVPLWLVSLVSLAGLFVLPQRWPNEEWGHARKRVRKFLLHDRASWVIAALLILLLIPLVNRGLCPGCDWERIAAGADPRPPLRFLPFCVSPFEHADVFEWFFASLTAALFVRAGLTRHGQRLSYEFLVWNGAALALFGFLRQAMTSPGQLPAGWDGFSIFGYVNHAGAFFTLSFALALGLWCYRMAELAARDPREDPPKHPVVITHYPVVAVVLTAIAVFDTVCRAAMMLTILLALLFFAYAVLASFTRERKHNRFAATSALLALMGLAVTIMTFAPQSVINELKTLSVRTVVDRASGKNQYHERVAMAMVRKYPIHGVGGWGYRHFCSSFMTEKECKAAFAGLQSGDGAANVHNDYLQFLVEHGVVGFGLMLAVFLLLWRTVMASWRMEYLSYRFVKSEQTPVSPIAVYCVSAPVFWTLIGTAVMMLHALGDCPLRGTAILATLLVSVTSAMGFFK